MNADRRFTNLVMWTKITADCRRNFVAEDHNGKVSDKDTGVYGLPDAVLVPSIGVSGGQWVPSGDKKPNTGQLVQTADGLRLVVVTPPAWRIGAPVWVRSIWPLAKCSATDPCPPITKLPICWLADRDQRAVWICDLV